MEPQPNTPQAPLSPMDEFLQNGGSASITPFQGADAAPVDQPQEIAQEWSAPESAGLYDLGLGYGAERDIASEGSFRNILHQEGAPLGVVNLVADIAGKALAGPMPSEVDSALLMQKCTVDLNRVWGADYSKNLAIVQAEAQRLMALHPAFVAVFDHPRIGNNPMVLAQVLAHAQNRKGARK